MDYRYPRCEAVPLAGQQVSLRVDGGERVRWHFGSEYPRPFFYPLLGPSGNSLTRMGHPGAPNHDHHRSIWFAHNKVVGIDFWSDNLPPRIRQSQWLVYEDGDEEALMAVMLRWFDGHNPEHLLEQELIATVRPLGDGETLLSLQSTFRPRAEMLEFGKTNFGFLAVRVARSISKVFGNGQLTSSEGRVGEPQTFGRPARWMDYSGPVLKLPADQGAWVVEGITYFDHPSNPRYPAPWHVRDDGWMGSAICLNEPLLTTREKPLVLRYRLHAHGGPIDPARADAVARQFAGSPAYTIRSDRIPHRQYQVVRTAE